MKTSILYRKIIPLLILLCIAASLLNSSAFGSDSLIALFFYSILAALLAVSIFISFLLSKKSFSFTLPLYLILFLLLSLYVLVHGILNNNIRLTHYYWITNAIFIVSIHYWVTSQQVAQNFLETQSIRFTFKGIVALALLESVIVLLQCVKLFPVPNQFFICTGTWSNPNVTAMFLALSLFAVIKVKFNWGVKREWIINSILVIILIAIVALRSRSAYLAAGVILFSEFGFTNIKSFFLKNINASNKGTAFSVFTAIILIIITTSFISKTDSTNNRISIWKNTINLIVEKPLTGYGFGMFEKEYNLFAAEQQNISNEHINMAYNDFLELGIEGGLPAVILWTGFLVTLLLYCHRNEEIVLSVSPVAVAFIFIQLTNFGFQAIPAMVLFLLFTGFTTKRFITEQAETGKQKFTRMIFSSLGVFISLLYLLHIAGLTGLFYKKWIISKKKTDANSIVQYKTLSSQLANYASYHESIGDAYQKIKQYQQAVSEYSQALKSTSNPDVFLKSAFCYQQLSIYDSSEYYYKIVQDMEPKRLIPQVGLLKLYQQKSDTVMVFNKANQILAMPAKINSPKVIEIKNYADSIRRLWRPKSLAPYRNKNIDTLNSTN